MADARYTSHQELFNAVILVIHILLEMDHYTRPEPREQWDKYLYICL